MLIAECLEAFQALMMELRRTVIRPAQLRGMPKIEQRRADLMGVGMLPLLYRATLRQQCFGPRPIFIQYRNLGQHVQVLGDTGRVAQLAVDRQTLGKPHPCGGAITLLPRQPSQVFHRHGIPPCVADLACKL